MLTTTRVNSAGHVSPWSTPTTDQVMDVLKGDLSSDGYYRPAAHWALAIFDQPDFIEDLSIDAKRELLELIASNPGTRYQHIYNHVRDTVADIVEQEK